MKYTAEYCRKNDIVVVCTTFEEYQEIKKIDNWSGTSLDRETVERNSPCYFYENSKVDGGWGSCSSRCFKDHKGSCTAEEFIRDNEMLPEKWMIKITEENHTFLDKYLKANSKNYPEYNITWTTDKTYNTAECHYYFYSEQPGVGVHSSTSKYDGFTEITFEQFLKIANQTNLVEFPKELIQLLEQIK